MTEHNKQPQDSNYRELMMLSELESTPDATHRQLAKRLRVSLGLTNLLLRNVLRKGYVRIMRAGWRSRLYAITPAGFKRKIYLVVTYIDHYLDHYRWVRRILREELSLTGLHEESRVALYGVGEFAELVFIGLKELGVDHVDVFSPDGTGETRFLGQKVQPAALLRAREYDRVVVGLLSDHDAFSELPGLEGVGDKLVTFFADEKRRYSRDGL